MNENGTIPGNDGGRTRPDPRSARLVALLYGELSPAEAEFLHRELDVDPGLRRDFEEISEARAALRELVGEDLVGKDLAGKDPAREGLAPVAGREPLRARRDVRPAAGIAPRLLRLLSGSGWGIAVAAALLLALGLARFRVERVDHGLAFRVGGVPVAALNRPAPGPAIGSRVDAPLPAFGTGGTVFENAGNLPATPPQTTQSPATSPQPVTRDELRAFTAEISRSMAVLLDDRARQRDAATAAWLQGAFEEMSRRQADDYGDLRYRIEQVGIGLAHEQSRANDQIDWLLRVNQQEQNPPAHVPATEEGETP